MVWVDDEEDERMHEERGEKDLERQKYVPQDSPTVLHLNVFLR